MYSRAVAAWSVTHAALSLAALAISIESGGPIAFALAGLASLALFAATVARPLTFASQITAVRVGLVCAGGVIGSARPRAAAALFAIAALLDLADGALARRRGEASPAGSAFDVEADAYLVGVAALLVTGLGRAGLWVLAPSVLRAVLVLARDRSHRRRERRSMFGRAAFALLAGGLIAVCACPATWSVIALALGVGAVTASFAVDFRNLLGSPRGTQEYFGI